MQELPVADNGHWADNNNNVVHFASVIAEPSSLTCIAIRDSRPNSYHELDWHRGNFVVTLETQILQQPPVGARCTAT